MTFFEEHTANICQHLSSIYEREKNWKEAASVLVGIPFETEQMYLFVIIMLFHFIVVIMNLYLY